MRLQDVRAEVVDKHPRLYAETMREGRASFFAQTLRWLLESMWHSAVVMGVPLLALWAPDASGRTAGLAAFGTTAYAAIVLVVNLKVNFRQDEWHFQHLSKLWAPDASGRPSGLWHHHHRVSRHRAGRQPEEKHIQSVSSQTVRNASKLQTL